MVSWTVWGHPAGKRGVFLHRRLVEVGPQGISVRRLGGDRAGEIRLTRFLRNAKVSWEEIFAEAGAATAERVRGLHVVAVQDTTSLRDDGAGRSLQAHAMLGVEAETGAALGLVTGTLLERRGGRAARRRARPAAAKESRRWLEGVEAAAALRQAGAASVTVVADRESDIYDLFARRPAEVELVVRAAQDRALAEGTRLFAWLAAAPEAGRMTVALPAAPGRPARQAELSLRFCRATIRRPEGRPAGVSGGAGLPASVPVNLIEAREIDPPPGATPALWRLVTTQPVESFAEARRITGLYRQRWRIEELFRTLKTRGFDIERVGVAEGPFEILAAAALVAAVSVLALVQEREGRAGRPLADVFHPDEQPALEAVCAQLEGKTARQRNPHPRGSLAYAAWVCARLGGWTGYYAKPGPIVMLRGLYQFRAIQKGWSLAGRQNV